MTIELKKPSYESKQLMTVPFEMKAFREDEDYFYFEAYLSTFGNKDRGDDVVERGAFIESLKVHTPILLAFHNTDEPAGIFESLVEDEVGLFVKGKMPKRDTYVSGRLIPQMLIGSIKFMSIGYSVWEQDGSMEISNGVRHLKKVFLWEGSLVTIPMNDQALIKTKSAMPFQEEMPIADRHHKWDEESVIERLKDWAGVKDNELPDTESQEKYKQAFLWHDEEEKDQVAAYRLPVADIIEGKLTIIPRAIFAASGRINGKGGLWIPRDELPRVVNTSEKYYKKMGLESPFGKSFRVDDFKAFGERDLEKLLRDGVCMSEKTSKTLVSLIKSDTGRDGSELDQRDAVKDDWKGVSDVLNDFLNDFKKD